MSAAAAAAAATATATVSIDQVAQHNTTKDCWIVLHGKVYNVTNFLGKHPGGAKIISRLAGKDASAQFDKFHALDILQSYIYDESISVVGQLEATAAAAAADAAKAKAQQESEQEESVINKYEPERLLALKNKPPLDHLMNLYDFEYVANRTLEPIARNYYSSGVDDEISTRENHYAYKRIFFNPRVLVDVTECDISATLLGSKTSVPFYVSATAMQKYAHPEGEKIFARGCLRTGVLQMVPCLSSFPFDDIMNEYTSGKNNGSSEAKKAPFWYQLYLSKHDGLNEELIRKVEKSGGKGIFITVDNVWGGNREKDKRTKTIINHLVKLEERRVKLSKQNGKKQLSKKELESLMLIQHDDQEYKDGDSSSGRLGRRAVTWLTWARMRHLKTITSMPFVIKGIQSVADVQLAIDNGMDGIVLSNHGGRQVDFSKAPIELLADINKLGLHKKINVFVDGGIRRGTDVVKALCLGAKAVGLGRGLLYPVATYGEAGLVRAIELLKDEMVATMRNIGITKLSELNESYVDLENLKKRCSNFGDATDLYHRASLPLVSPQFNKVKL